MQFPTPEHLKYAEKKFSTPNGLGASIFETDVVGRPDMRYGGKKLTDPVNMIEVIFFAFFYTLKNNLIFN